MISQKAKYAPRALIALAEAPKGATMHISEIATQQNIPQKFLERILLDLRNQAIIRIELYQFSLKLTHKGFPRSPNADSLCRTMEVRDGSAGGCFAERF